MPLVFGNWETNELKKKAAPEAWMCDLGKIIWRSCGLEKINLWVGETTNFSRVAQNDSQQEGYIAAVSYCWVNLFS